MMVDPDLPAPETARLIRWTAARKAAVVKAIGSGVLPRADALDRYALSDDELTSWEARHATRGLSALKVKDLDRGKPRF